ncbi:MAG: DNA polymerase/3'-5' exonuclease PolX [Phycisphaerae bacterium]|nr:DNA polymerase/3'-5' exonuclease PolX [Phycisphaerae bacterium]
MTNADVARVFDEIADILEIKGADGFRVNSYRRVARQIDDLASDINEVAARGELAKLPGVGKSSAEKINELLETGELKMRGELLAEVPESLLELLKVPGLGPKKVALLWRERSINSLGDLKQAIEGGKLADLKGFGKKSIEQMSHGIAFLESSAGRRRLGTAWAVGTRLRELVEAMPGVRRVEHAGSLRRGCETVGDLDLLCVADDAEGTIKAFTELEDVTQVLAAGGTKGSILYQYRPRRSMQVDLRIVSEESFGAAWQYFTGSKEHNVRLRELAVKRGWSLNEYGLTEGELVIASRTEEEIYAALDLPCPPPEFREDRFEFDLKEIPTDLITREHIRGDLHMHTVASDGVNTIEEMARAAKKLGYEYICVTDHSASSAIANGLSADRLSKQIEEIHAINKRLKGVTVWAGSEVDILAGGKLDFPDELLAELDFAIASIHYGMGSDIKENTQRTLEAMQSPYINVIGHPTGRLLTRRDAMPLDIEAVAKEAARTGTALEMNSSHHRLDLKDQHARLARDCGAMICINTDAHATDQFEEIRFGIVTARRGGLLKGDVVNTQTAAQIRKFVERKRSG